MDPKKYSSPSPQNNDAQPPPTKPWDITPRQLFSLCFFDGECSQLNPTHFIAEAADKLQLMSLTRAQQQPDQKQIEGEF